MEQQTQPPKRRRRAYRRKVKTYFSIVRKKIILVFD